MTNDERLIHDIMGGDRDCFGALVEPYIDRLHAISYSYLGDAHAAEDVTQDALIRAFTSLRTLADPGKFGPWLRQITRNLSRSEARRKKCVTVDPADHREIPDGSVEAPGDRIQIREAGDLLQDALASISPKISETVVLFYLKNQSLRQIAGFLGVSENTVKQRLHRGRLLLRERLEEMVLKDGRRKVELSEHFLPGVMAALPAQPAANSLLAETLAKLAALPPLWPLLSKLLVVMACSGGTGMLLVSDVDPSNQRARRSLWISTAVAIILTLGIVLVTWTLVPRLEGPHFVLGLSLFLLLPFAFITIYFYRAGATGRMQLSMLFYLAIVACIVCMVVFPQHAVLFALCLGPLFAGATAAEASWNPALTRPGSGDPPAMQGDPPSARPVSIDFLHENAGKFLKVLNTPFPLFHNIAREADHVRYSAHPPLVGKLIRRLSKLTERWGIPWCRIGSARLHPDGSVEYEVYSKDGFPAHWGSVEEEEARVGDYIAKSWAFFAAGDETGARSLTPDFFPKQIYPTRKGRNTLTIVIYALAAIMAATAIYQLLAGH